jgi:MFS family permease
MGEVRRPKGIAWVYSVFPFSIANGPIGTIVQLYLIELNGQALGTIYGGLASAFYNGISIPGAIFWGVAVDRLHKRKGLIALGYALTAVALVTFYFVRTTGGTISAYSVFSFVSIAAATPFNLLIMESESKSRWASAFARLSMVSGVGNVIGFLISVVWTDVLPAKLILLFLPMGAFAVASSAMSLALIHEPDFVFEKETVVGRRQSFFARLLANPIFFVTIPTLSDFQRAFRGIRSTLTRGVPLFYISTILFYFSSGLFNTSFVPAMHLFSMPDQEVFGVILAGMAVQTVSFRYAGNIVRAHNLIDTSVQGLLLRGWSYLGVGAAALFFTGQIFAVLVGILYALASGVAFAIYYTSSNTMMFTSVQSKSAGAALGVYSAVVGIATMGGSLISGFVSVYNGYYVTFVASGVMLLVAVLVVGRLPKPSSPDESALQ